MKKNIIAVIAAAALLLIVILNLDIQTPEQYYTEHQEDITSDSLTVTLSVDCVTIMSDSDRAEKILAENTTIPPDGVIIPETEYVLHKGDTVFDILNRSLKYNKIHFDYTGGENVGSVYVKGINNIYDYDCGDLSGWMYSVNGKFPQVACSEYVLQDGDVICWRYTCDLGRDVGDDYYDNEKN